MFILENMPLELQNMVSVPLSEDVTFKKHPNLLRCEEILQEIIDEDKKLVPDRFAQSKRRKLVQDILKNHFQFDSLFLSIGKYTDPLMSTYLGYQDGIAIHSEKKRAAANGASKEKIHQVGIDTHMACRKARAVQMNAANAMNMLNFPTALKKYMTADVSDMIENTGDRLCFRKTNIIMDGTITILPGMYRRVNTTMSGAGLLAIILHEVGHSFYLGTKVSRSFNMLVQTVNLPLYVLTKLNCFIYDLVERLFGKTEATSYIYGKIYGLIDQGFNLLYFVDAVLKPLISGRGVDRANALATLARYSFDISIIEGIRKYISEDLAKYAEIFTLKLSSVMTVLDPIINSTLAVVSFINSFIPTLVKRFTSLLLLDGNQAEEFCDMFAAVHGYGADLHNALIYRDVAELFKKADYKANVFESFVRDMSAIETVFIFNHIFDPHPENSGRSLRMLENFSALRAQAKTKAQRDLIDQQMQELIAVIKSVKQVDKEAVLEMYRKGDFDGVIRKVYGKFHENAILNRDISKFIDNGILKIDSLFNKAFGGSTYKATTMADVDTALEKKKDK